jgi:hypothetical protein
MRVTCCFCKWQSAGFDFAQCLFLVKSLDDKDGTRAYFNEEDRLVVEVLVQCSADAGSVLTVWAGTTARDVDDEF